MFYFYFKYSQSLDSLNGNDFFKKVNSFVIDNSFKINIDLEFGFVEWQ